MKLDPEWMRKTAYFSTLSVEIVLYVGVGVFLGDFLDEIFESGPFLLIGLGVIGLFLAFMKIFYTLKKTRVAKVEKEKST